MPNADVLSRLTADRLEELANECADESRPLALGDAEQVAAVLRALAGAERGMIRLSNLHGYPSCAFAQTGSEIFACSSSLQNQAENVHPTLIAALASVAKQE